MHEVEITGTFLGHLVLGLFLTSWGLLWLVGEVRARGRGADTPVERSSALSVLKIVLPSIVAWFEIPNSGWEPAHALQGWQHITMYFCFALTGVVDLLVTRGVFTPRASYMALAGALGVAGFLFVGHGGHGGVPGVAHMLLAMCFLGAAVIAVAEGVRPGVGLEWFRMGLVLSLGGWLLSISWVLYHSDWEMMDPVRVGWTYLLFALNAIAAAIITMCASVLAGRAAPGSDP